MRLILAAIVVCQRDLQLEVPAVLAHVRHGHERHLNRNGAALRGTLEWVIDVLAYRTLGDLAPPVYVSLVSHR